MSNFDKVPEGKGVPEPLVRRRLAGLVWVSGLLAVGLGFYGWRQVQLNEAARLVRVEKIHGLEMRLQTLAAQLGASGDEPDPAQKRQWLEEGIARQTELMRARDVPVPSDGQRLAEWQTRLADSDAHTWSRQSAELAAAALALEATDAPAAARKLSEALALQQKVNRSPASPALKNQLRETQLMRAAERLVAVSPRAGIVPLLARARQSAAAGQWAEALSLYGEADGIMRRSREAAPVPDGTLPSAAQMASEVAAVRAAQASAGVETMLQQAVSAAAAGRTDDADRYYENAASGQKSLNERFSGSRYVSMEKLARIATDRQTLQARALVHELIELDGRAQERRRKRELFQAQEWLAQAAEKLEAVRTRYPLAEGVDDGLRRRVTFLSAHATELVAMQDAAYELLQALPGNGALACSKTEVPQSLFTQVMHRNPSRRVAPSLPVDSLTPAEAGEFCQRLGWILGVPVRLPTERELAAAMKGAAATGADTTRAKGFRVVAEIDLRTAW